jgi:hypothetical protein
MRPQFGLRFRRNALATPARLPIERRPLYKVRADCPRKDRALKPQRDAGKRIAIRSASNTEALRLMPSSTPLLPR